MQRSDQIITKYKKDKSNEFWWCNSHERKATYLQTRITNEIVYVINHHCDPKLGGIMLPCRCVNLTGLVEIDDENNKV